MASWKRGAQWADLLGQTLLILGSMQLFMWQPDIVGLRILSRTVFVTSLGQGLMINLMVTWTQTHLHQPRRPHRCNHSFFDSKLKEMLHTGQCIMCYRPSALAAGSEL